MALFDSVCYMINEQEIKALKQIINIKSTQSFDNATRAKERILCTLTNVIFIKGEIGELYLTPAWKS